MAALTIVYWRDIPAQVIVKAGRKQARRQLGNRFQEAIDEAAMRAGLHGSDDYLDAWRRSAPKECGEDVEAEAEAAQTRLEAEYDEVALGALVMAGGRANGEA